MQIHIIIEKGRYGKVENLIWGLPTISNLFYAIPVTQMPLRTYKFDLIKLSSLFIQQIIAS